MLKKISKFTIWFLICAIVYSPSITMAEGKVFSIKKGQKAPFAGTLFDVDASASLTVRLESQKTQCELSITKARDVCKNESMFKLNLKIAELEALQQRHIHILEIKNNQIEFLQKKEYKNAI